MQMRPSFVPARDICPIADAARDKSDKPARRVITLYDVIARVTGNYRFTVRNCNRAVSRRPAAADAARWRSGGDRAQVAYVCAPSPRRSIVQRTDKRNGLQPPRHPFTSANVFIV